MTDLHRLAAHEAGHAVAAWILGRANTLVSLDYPPVGGGVSIDRMPSESLGYRRRPLAAWHAMEDDCLIVLAGPLSERIDHDADEPPLPLTPQRVPDDDPDTIEDLGPVLPPLPVVWQAADKEPEWPELPQSDADQVYRLTAGIASSEEERAALEHTLTLRAWAMCNGAHYKALHAHLTDALLRRGELHATDIRHELQRAELRFLTKTIPEADYGPQAA
jgi:hypothetical protein